MITWITCHFLGGRYDGSEERLSTAPQTIYLDEEGITFFCLGEQAARLAAKGMPPAKPDQERYELVSRAGVTAEYLVDRDLAKRNTITIPAA